MPKGAIKFRKALSIGLTSAIVVSNTPVEIFANENIGVKQEEIQIEENITTDQEQSQIEEKSSNWKTIKDLKVSANKEEGYGDSTKIIVNNNAYFKIVTSSEVTHLKFVFPKSNNWTETYSYSAELYSVKNTDGTITWDIEREFTTINNHEVSITPIKDAEEGSSTSITVDVEKYEGWEELIGQPSVSDAEIELNDYTTFEVTTDRGVKKLKLTFPKSNWSEYHYANDLNSKIVDGKRIWTIKRQFTTIDNHEVLIAPIIDPEEGSSSKPITVNVVPNQGLKFSADPLVSANKEEGYSNSTKIKVNNNAYFKIITGSEVMHLEFVFPKSDNFTETHSYSAQLYSIKNRNGDREWTIERKFITEGEHEVLITTKKGAVRGETKNVTVTVDKDDDWKNFDNKASVSKGDNSFGDYAEVELNKEATFNVITHEEVKQLKLTFPEINWSEYHYANDLNSKIVDGTRIWTIERKFTTEGTHRAYFTTIKNNNGGGKTNTLTIETISLSKKKSEAIEALSSYVNKKDYSDRNWKKILEIIDTYKAKINGAIDIAGVEKELQNGKTEIDKVLKKAEEKKETYEYFNLVKESIAQIPNDITDITLEHKEVIENTRSNFDKINPLLLSLWDALTYGEWLVKLEFAEGKLQSLIKAVDNVIKLIDAIGKVEHNDESWKKIDAARKAYDALDDTLKTKFPSDKLQILINAENKYSELDPVPGLRANAEKEIKNYVNVEFYNDESKEAINKIIADACKQIYASESEDQMKEIVSKAKSEIDKFENDAATMRENSKVKFETLKVWKGNLIKIKENMNNPAISVIIDTQIARVEVASGISIDKGIVVVDFKSYNLESNHDIYTVEEKISNAIDKAISTAEESDKLVDGELSKIVDKLIGDGISIGIGKSAITGITIPQGLNKENTIEAIAKALTVKDFVIDINGTMNEIEIPTDKVDMKALENLIKQSEPVNSNITSEDIIEIVKALPALKLNIDWNTDGFSNKVGEESKVVSNITIGVSLGDLVNLATNPSFENIINSLLEGQNIDLTLIKYVAEYLNIDLNKYNVGLGYKLDFVFDVKDILINTTTNLGTLKLPVGIDSTKVNDILKSLEGEFVEKILDLDYSGNTVEISISSEWDEYTAETKQLTGVINVKLGDIALSKHTVILDVQHIEDNGQLESELENIKQKLNDFINNAVDKEQVKEIIAKLNKLKDFIKNNPNLR